MNGLASSSLSGRTELAKGRASRPLSRRVRRRMRKGTTVALATVWLLIVLIPLYYMLLATFRTQGTYLTADPWLPTSQLSISSYTTVFDGGLGRYLLNSLLVTVVSLALILVLSLGAAFRVMRRATPASRNFMKLVVIGLAIPLQAIIVPVYLLVIKLGLYDSSTEAGVILVLSASAVPISVLIMVNFIRDIPNELYDAMGVDGANEWTVFWKLVWPLARPVLATVAIYDGLNVWNNFLVPLVLTSTPNHALLPLGLLHFQTEYTINVPAIMAAVWLSMLPLLALFLVMRRQVIRSLGGIALR
jgi:raffinose/stachyose/melibiose transport system permease protein